MQRLLQTLQCIERYIYRLIATFFKVSQKSGIRRTNLTAHHAVRHVLIILILTSNHLNSRLPTCINAHSVKKFSRNNTTQPFIETITLRPSVTSRSETNWGGLYIKIITSVSLNFLNFYIFNYENSKFYR